MHASVLMLTCSVNATCNSEVSFLSASDFIFGSEGNRTEISFMVRDTQEVDVLYQQWSDTGVLIEQAPGEAVFGRTFAAPDPDGHRIRVCIPELK